MKPYFTTIKKGKNGLYYFQFIAPNGEPLFSSEGYSTRQSAKKGISDIIKNLVLYISNCTIKV